LLVLLVAVSVQASRPPITGDTVIWELKQPRVVDPGQTIVLPPDPETGFPGGVQITGYILEAKAKSRQENLIKNGIFRLELSLFKPDADMPGQKAGRWYIQGRWTIAANSAQAATKEKHNKLGFAQGSIITDLEINPIAEPMNWTAYAVLPMSTVDKRWMKGEGVYSVNAAWEGDLFLKLDLWPQGQ
jgi:hypothetical protein